MRRFLLIALVPLVVGCSGPAASPPAPAAVGGPVGAVTAPKPEAQAAAGKPEPKQSAKAETKPAADTRPQPQAAAPSVPKAVIAPPAENHGIALGQPFKSGANGSVVLVTNTTDQVMTFTVRTEYRKGADVISLSSKVSDLRPKQSWPAFSAGGRMIPSDPDSITVAVETVHAAASTSEKAEVMKMISVSEPKKVDGTDNVTVEITNNDPKGAHVLSVRSAYMKGDEMVAHGESGSPPRLAPGETLTVKVRPVTSLTTYDKVEVMVKTL